MAAPQFEDRYAEVRKLLRRIDDLQKKNPGNRKLQEVLRELLNDINSAHVPSAETIKRWNGVISSVKPDHRKDLRQQEMGTRPEGKSQLSVGREFTRQEELKAARKKEEARRLAEALRYLPGNKVPDVANRAKIDAQNAFDRRADGLHMEATPEDFRTLALQVIEEAKVTIQKAEDEKARKDKELQQQQKKKEEEERSRGGPRKTDEDTVVIPEQNASRPTVVQPPASSQAATVAVPNRSGQQQSQTAAVPGSQNNPPASSQTTSSSSTPAQAQTATAGSAPPQTSPAKTFAEAIERNRKAQILASGNQAGKTQTEVPAPGHVSEPAQKNNPWIQAKAKFEQFKQTNAAAAAMNKRVQDLKAAGQLSTAGSPQELRRQASGMEKQARDIRRNVRQSRFRRGGNVLRRETQLWWNRRKLGRMSKAAMRQSGLRPDHPFIQKALAELQQSPQSKITSAFIKSEQERLAQNRKVEVIAAAHATRWMFERTSEARSLIAADRRMQSMSTAYGRKVVGREIRGSGSGPAKTVKKRYSRAARAYGRSAAYGRRNIGNTPYRSSRRIIDLASIRRRNPSAPNIGYTTGDPEYDERYADLTVDVEVEQDRPHRGNFRGERRLNRSRPSRGPSNGPGDNRPSNYNAPRGPSRPEPPKGPPRRRPPLPRGGGGTGKLAANVIKAASNIPIVRIIIIAILLIILVIVIILVIFGGDAQQKNNTCNGQAVQESMNITIEGPDKTALATPDIEYTITITDTKNATEIPIVYYLPDGISLAVGPDGKPLDISSSWPGFTFDPAQKTLAWKANAQSLPPNGVLTPPNLVFTVRIKAIQDNVHLINRIQATNAAGAIGSATGLPRHGGFAVHTPEAVNQAADLGAQYVIPYGWGTLGRGVNPADPASPMGQALKAKNMKVMVDVTKFEFDITPTSTRIKSYIYTCQNGTVVPDLNHVTNIVNQSKDSELTIGYWAKDDDVKNCGSMKEAVKQVYSKIKELDPNPNHFVVAGFSDTNSLQTHFDAGQADVVAVYPYPAYVGDGAIALTVPAMVNTIKQKSPQAKVMGIYQAFSNDPARPGFQTAKRKEIPIRSAEKVKSDAQAFLNAPVDTLVALGWDLQDLKQGPGNIPEIADAVKQVSTLAGNAPAVPGAGGAGGSGCGAGGPINENFTPASADACGKYDFSKWPEKNPLNNFGDPTCNFSKDKLAELINQKDPQNLHIWLDVIPMRETGGTWSPNAHAPGSGGVQASIDAGGAWGLYQMGSSNPPGQPPPAPGKNGPLDRGDVNWELQLNNAIQYNREKCGGDGFWYWRSSREGEIPGAHPC